MTRPISSHFSSFRASQTRFFSIFPSKSAKVAVDFKGALFFCPNHHLKGRILAGSSLLGAHGSGKISSYHKSRLF